MSVAVSTGRYRALPWRLAAWGRERYPLAVAGVLAPAYLVAVLFGRALSHPGPPRPRPSDAAGFAAVWAFFLMVRILDDHKDYARDRVTHPGRLLQRGVVTLDQLKTVAVGAWAVQFAAVLAVERGPGRVGLWWLVTLGWTALAARDFFLGTRVADRPVLYPLLHLPLSGLACLWMAQVGAGTRALPATGLAVAALGVAVAGCVDVTRKLVPDGGGRGYAVALGARRAAGAGALAVAIHTLVLVAVVRLGGGSVAVTAAVPLLAVAPLAALARYATVPVPASASASAGTAAPAHARPARYGLVVVVPAQLAVAAAALLVGAGRW
ncbi:hypothetical protein ACNTMW_00890 [Planosporangium sp. 12N6]|uniref:hypothetical protein n=1 Tax=Planosporangium spinosum TaxID=3402278 RepID=UPI003CFAF941